MIASAAPESGYTPLQFSSPPSPANFPEVTECLCQAEYVQLKEKRLQASMKTAWGRRQASQALFALNHQVFLELSILRFKRTSSSGDIPATPTLLAYIVGWSSLPTPKRTWLRGAPAAALYRGTKHCGEVSTTPSKQTMDLWHVGICPPAKWLSLGTGSWLWRGWEWSLCLRGTTVNGTGGSLFPLHPWGRLSRFLYSYPNPAAKTWVG